MRSLLRPASAGVIVLGLSVGAVSGARADVEYSSFGEFLDAISSGIHSHNGNGPNVGRCANSSSCDNDARGFGRNGRTDRSNGAVADQHRDRGEAANRGGGQSDRDGTDGSPAPDGGGNGNAGGNTGSGGDGDGDGGYGDGDGDGYGDGDGDGDVRNGDRDRRDGDRNHRSDRKDRKDRKDRGHKDPKDGHKDRKDRGHDRGKGKDRNNLDYGNKDRGGQGNR